MSRGGSRICYATQCMFRARAGRISERRAVLVFVRCPVAAGGLFSTPKRPDRHWGHPASFDGYRWLASGKSVGA